MGKMTAGYVLVNEAGLVFSGLREGVVVFTNHADRFIKQACISELCTDYLALAKCIPPEKMAGVKVARLVVEVDPTIDIHRSDCETCAVRRDNSEIQEYPTDTSWRKPASNAMHELLNTLLAQDYASED